MTFLICRAEELINQIFDNLNGLRRLLNEIEVSTLHEKSSSHTDNLFQHENTPLEDAKISHNLKKNAIKIEIDLLNNRKNCAKSDTSQNEFKVET